MNDFIKLFSQEVIATIEGLMGATPDLSLNSNNPVSGLAIQPPYAITTIETKGDFSAIIAMLTPVDLATALADTMVGGEGASKDNMDNDDLDAIKEINSNIFGAISTNLNSQKALPKLSFSVKSIDFVTSNQDLSSYAQGYNFAFSLNNIKSFFILLSSQEFENAFNGQSTPSNNTPQQQEKESVSTNLSADEMKNIGMLLDVKLNIKVRIGQKRMLLKDVISMDIGSVIELNQLANEPLEILIDDKVIAKGEVVIVDGNFGIQVTEIGTKRQRLEQLRN